MKNRQKQQRMENVRYWTVAALVILLANFALIQNTHAQDFNTRFFELFSAQQFQPALDFAEGHLKDLEASESAHPYELSAVYTNIGHAREALNNLDEAEKAFKKALKITSLNFGGESQLTAVNHQNLGVFFYRKMNYDDAIIHFSESLNIGESLFGKNDPHLVEDLMSLASSFEKKQMYPEAEQFLIRALEINKERYPTGNQNIKDVALAMVKLYDLSKNFEARDRIAADYEVKLDKTDCNCDKKDSLTTDPAIEKEKLTELNLNKPVLEESEIEKPDIQVEADIPFTESIGSSFNIEPEKRESEADTSKLNEDQSVSEVKEELQTEQTGSSDKEEIPEYHTVLKSETLFSISRQYGLSVKEITDKNKLTGNTIYVGQKLRIR